MTTFFNDAHVTEQVSAEVVRAADRRPEPLEFLPKDRDAALFMVKQKLYHICLGEGGKKKIRRQIYTLLDMIERS